MRLKEKRPRARSLWIGALAVLAVACLAPAQASAGGHNFLGTFCEPTGIGTAPCSPNFSVPAGMAVDQSSGDVLVIDVANQTVSRFKPNGEPDPFSALGTNVIDGKGTQPCTPPSVECDATPQGEILKNIGEPNGVKELQVAIDESGDATDGDIYVTDPGNHVLDVFAPSGTYLGQLTEFKEGPLAEGASKPLGEPCGVAVDDTGDVYVGDFSSEDLIHKYSPAGANVANFNSLLGTSSPCTLALGSGPTAGFVFVDRLNGELFKLDAGTGELKYKIADANTTVAVDPASGHVFTTTGKEVREYDASGATAPTEPLSSILLAQDARGVAVNETTGRIFITRGGSTQVEVWSPAITVPKVTTEASNPIGPREATLKGTVNPSGAALAECAFEYDTTPYAKEGEAHGTSVPCEPSAAEIGGGGSPVAVHAGVSGLEPGTTYHFRLVAANANGASQGEDEVFKTTGPTVSAALASEVSETAATISGEVNPNGEETAYLVQYVTQAQFEASAWAEAQEIPSAPEGIGSGSGFVEVSQGLTGLTPDTAYRARLLVSGPAGEFPSAEASFATFPPTAEGLPDSRAYELVSPAVKKGEVIPPEPSGNIGSSCVGCLPGLNGTLAPMQSTADGDGVAYEGQPFAEGLASGPNSYIGRRGAGGWGIEMISKPQFREEVDGQGFQGFSEDLRRGVLYQTPALTEEAATKEGKSFLNFYRWEEGALEALVSEANVPPNRSPGRFSVLNENAFRLLYGAANAGSSPAEAFTHIVFAANDALTGEVPGIAPAAVDGGGGTKLVNLNLYEWSGGELHLVNVAPGNGATAPGAVLGSGRLLEKQPAAVQFQDQDVANAVSADGSRIFFSEEGSGQTYVRIDGKRTVEIPDHSASFLSASADGSKVLLSDGRIYGQLDPTPVEEADLTAGQGGFEGILGAAEDLSRIYFVDTAALSGEEENANGEKAAAGKDNLYLWEEGAVSFIGRLVARDNDLGGDAYGAWKASPGNRTAQVSADGRYLAFMSLARLSGYDNTAASGKDCQAGIPACLEVFEYEAQAGTLVCASCNPSGERPLGASNLSLVKPIPAFSSLPQPTNLTAGGRLFFESQDALSPHDTNGLVLDVYEFEPKGVGDCERAKGCVSPISSGHSDNDSMFMDASPSGENAFFITREQLLAKDKDERLDLYDARVGGGFAETLQPPCEGDACKGASTQAPSESSAGSASFSGPPNQVKKHKNKRKKHHKRRHRHRRAEARQQGGVR